MSQSVTTKTLTSELAAPESALLDQIISGVAQTIQRSAPAVQPMELRTFDELERWALMAAKSAMVPKDYKDSPANIILAVQMGAELGLRPMQSLQNIAVINGRPSVWGDAMLALCKTHPAYISTEEIWSGSGDDYGATCTMIRRGEPPVVRTFTIAQAKKAALWGKTGPWQQYPDRMLQMRARGFAARDAYPDKLRGLVSVEEAQDYPLEAAGITPRHEPASAAPAPVVAAPEAPRRPTIAQWIDALEAELAAAPDAEAVDAIHSRADVQKALDSLTNGARDRLNAVVKAALDRTGVPVPEAADEEVPF